MFPNFRRLSMPFALSIALTTGGRPYTFRRYSPTSFQLGCNNPRGVPIPDRSARGGVGRLRADSAGNKSREVELASVALPFESPIDTRELPLLPMPAGWRDVLSRSFLVNGELESAYFEWKAALSLS